MARKATDQVTTIGIDIGNNSFHLIGLDGRSGSRADERGRRHEGPLLGVKRTERVEKQTLALEGPLLGPERTYWRHGRRVRC